MVPMPMETSADDLVTSGQLARILGVSRQAINKAAREGRLPVASSDSRGRLYSLRAVTAHLRGLVR